MTTAKSVLEELKRKGSEKTRTIYARHGTPFDRTFGVSVADLKIIVKKLKNQQELALELFETGNADAMYLAGLVASGSQMTKKQLESWAEGAVGLNMVAEYTVPWVAVESPYAEELAAKWIKSKNEYVASTGWRTYSGIVTITDDKSLPFALIENLLDTVIKQIKTAPNRVRYAMNAFLISVGSYVKPLSKRAKDAAKTIGEVTVDMGDTDCKVPFALTYIEKMEKSGKLGQKRKTIRC